jgi:hypothetical protein
MLAFSKLAILIWEISVPSAKQIYAMVIRSILAYAAPSWHKIKRGLKKLSKAFNSI